MSTLKDLKSISKNISILYVEDDTTLRESVAKYLRLIFERVNEAGDGQIGLEMFKNGSYDIVITDIQMPNMNGLEMIGAMKKLKPNQMFLITTAYGDSNYFLESIALDVNGYILKPLEFEKLNATLSKLVQNISLHRENQNYKKNLEAMVRERTAQNFLLQEDKIENYEQTLLSLVELVEMRDTYTGGHSQRVAKYCKLIAQKMGYDDEQCELVYKAGILHDIGKIGTPDAVLLKPSHLDKLEFSVMKEHVNVSANLLRKIPMYRELADVVASHHEHYDGSGYPKGLKKNEIPELARIMIVADAFDAMTTNRIYKGRKELKDAIEELKKYSGSQFDPSVVKYATEALAGVTVDKNIFQLPSNEMEHTRFAYFYKDQITGAYNKQYLELVLAQYTNAFKEKKITLIFTHNFSAYNKQYGWDRGNIYLTKIVKYFSHCCKDALVFRVQGDDFVVISDNEVHIESSMLSAAMKETTATHLSFNVKELNNVKDKIKSLSDLENYLSNEGLNDDLQI